MCGFCTPGFVMATRRAAREDIRTRRPSRSSKGLDGNICRCGTFVAHHRSGVEREGGGPWLSTNQQPPPAAAAASRRRPPPSAEKYAWPAKPVVLGTSVKRLDGPDKVTGRAKYTFDINRPGMLYGRIVRSPHPHARIVSIDLTAAQKAPGVKAALVWKEAGRRR